MTAGGFLRTVALVGVFVSALGVAALLLVALGWMGVVHTGHPLKPRGFTHLQAASFQNTAVALLVPAALTFLAFVGLLRRRRWAALACSWIAAITALAVTATILVAETGSRDAISPPTILGLVFAGALAWICVRLRSAAVLAACEPPTSRSADSST